MKKMTTLTMAILLSAAIHLHAQDGYHDHLVIVTADGETTFPLESLRLTIADGALTATSNGEQCSFTLSGITRMYFSDSDATRIENQVMLAASSTADYGCYDLTGRKCVAPAHGVYVIRNNGTIKKVVVK